MKNLKIMVSRLPRNAQAVLGVLVGVFAVAVLMVLVWSWNWYATASEQLHLLEPRYARLMGYSDSTEQLRASARDAAQQLVGLTYPAEADMPSSGARAQQQLREVLTAAGLAVSGSQVLSPVEHEGFAEIRIDLTTTGPMAGLEQALLSLYAEKPLVFVHSVDITPQRNRRQQEAGQEVVVKLGVSVVKLQ